MEQGSVWLATAELPRHPALAADLEVDVAVVGGGLVGLTTALLVARDGARVAVLEAAGIGAGTSGRTTGKVTSQHGLIYADLADRHGGDVARGYAEANQEGLAKVAELAGQLPVDCEDSRLPAFAYAVRPEGRERIAAEVLAAQQAGLPATGTTDVPLPFPVSAAIRFDDQLLIHPGRYLAGLAGAVSAAGGMIFDGTRIGEFDKRGNDGVRLTAVNGVRVHADRAVLATLLPPGLVGGYFARTRPTRSYALAVTLRGPAPEAMTISVDDTPTRSLRPWRSDGLIVVGNDHEPGAEADTEAGYRDLETWARANFDVVSVDHRWAAQDYRTPDRLPYVGRTPFSSRILTATGFAKWGLSSGTAAALVLADLIAGRPGRPWQSIFDATRIGDAASVGRLIKDNLSVGTEFVGGRFGAAGDPADLAPGRGGLIMLDGNRLGGYRDPGGTLHAVTPTCTHLGCPLHWNQADTSWDCRCHGSRFDADGAVLEGPAVEPLARHEPAE
ncbi:FAD-dependent oxidoreductase [Microlunatus parietis]|uniref:Glycine/D-amino acid oxidase-like deaminating enzyme/nitrite reductase/ring-hydroxylating ferredoxin subunit n=1 Tax=Microlunatus parietis TaxID=682979 RepID=A0A7Y9LB43_9ACTN|nr:FAD-dependent oxidoreductase [Microlunatus parietis]NYE69436.1 glycine/D-amino acid oxidase-like deaminating enzyme/nitrite reductase/ring-hydroxylating ferredoxin subunit [Microlunatus parietis]